jgi:prenyltransferase beta subunit
VARSLAVVLAAALLVPPAAPAVAGDKEGDSPGADPAVSNANRITPEQQAAIDRGLEFLKSRQEEDGGYSTTPPKEKSRGADYKTAITALATLAFLGAGHGLRHGPYTEQVRKGVEWLLRAQDESAVPGYISKPGDNQSRMHGHGFATLALAEAYGTASPPEAGSATTKGRSEADRQFSKRLHDAIQRAVELIQDSQSSTGGWDYEPGSGASSNHEGSVTVCEVQALLAAGNRGFKVSMDRIQAARRYMKNSQGANGGFKYRLSQEDSDQYSWALSAAGVCSLLGLNEFDRKEAIDKGFEYMNNRNRRPWLDSSHGYRFYGSFYAVQVYHWLGGAKWEAFWNPMRSALIGQQRKDGNWEGHDTQIDFGEVYPTAFTLLVLEVPVGYLSIYAR